MYIMRREYVCFGDLANNTWAACKHIDVCFYKDNHYLAVIQGVGGLSTYFHQDIGFSGSRPAQLGLTVLLKASKVTQQ